MQQAQQGGVQDPYAQQPPWPQQASGVDRRVGVDRRIGVLFIYVVNTQDVYAPRPPAYANMQQAPPSTSGQPPLGYDSGYGAAENGYAGESWQQRAGMEGYGPPMEEYGPPPSSPPGEYGGAPPYTEYPPAGAPPPPGADGQWGAARPAPPGGVQRTQRGRREDPYISVDDWEL